MRAGARWRRAMMGGAAGAVVLTLAVLLVPGGYGARPAAAQAGGFRDVAEDSFAAGHVSDLAAAGVFDGTECAAGRLCPDTAMDRKTMAVWTVRVLDGRDPGPVAAPRFNDVDADGLHAPFVERMAQLGITRGCGDGDGFCPDEAVSRAQMAAFLSRAFGLPDDPGPSPGPGFSDVDDDAWYAQDVARLAASGVTRGCGGGRFCPRQRTTRAQMAVFLDRARTPTAALESMSPPVVGGRFHVSIGFSAPVRGLSRSDVIVVNGRARSLRGSGASYNVVVEPAAEGAVMVAVPAGAASDARGTPNDASAPLVRVNGPGARPDAPGIDTWNRPLVMQSARREFDREEPDWGYTGDVAECRAGTTSKAFRDSVIQRVNWYRRMAGLNTVTENPEMSEQAQHGALIMAANRRLSHNPTRDWLCFSEKGAQGAQSNLAQHTAGVDGISGYMQDSGDNNLAVGHRRWILVPRTLQVGTGDVRESSRYNALKVLGSGLAPRREVRERRGFVSWPPSGYVPAGVVWGRWSFSLDGADFSDATVAMSDDSGPVETTVIDRSQGAGENSIVWAVDGDANSDPLPAPSGGDRCYAVTVSGVRIENKTQAPFQYPVCVIDPNAPIGPSVTLISSTGHSGDTDNTVGGSFEVTATFSEPVRGFTRDDIYVVNGAVTALSGSGRRYRATVTADDNGEVVVAVVAGAVHSGRSLPSTPSVPLSLTADIGRPAVRLASSEPDAVIGDFKVNITFTEPVEGFKITGLRVVNGSATALSGSGASYTATIVPAAKGTVMVRVRPGAARDADRRTNTASAPLTRTLTRSTARPRPGFDTWDRSAVAAGHRAEFDRDEPDWGYTGDVGSCVAGTTSKAFRRSVLRRLNWYRQTAGLSPVTESAAHTAAAQQVALIYLANGTFTVTKASKCHTAEGESAVGQGPSWLGIAGRSIIDASIEGRGNEFSRRNILMPWLRQVGMGHARHQASVYGVASMLYTDFNDPWRSSRPSVREERGFVAWPAAGYAPSQTVAGQWSFSLNNADFTDVAVAVEDHSGPLPVTVTATKARYHEQTVWWSVEGVSGPIPRRGPTDADHCYTVTVSGVKLGGTTQSPYEYAICVLNPKTP